MVSRAFFINDTAPTEIYTLSLHDALPIFRGLQNGALVALKIHAAVAQHEKVGCRHDFQVRVGPTGLHARSEDHTSELQSRLHLVCRLLLEKKKTTSVYKSVAVRLCH